MELKEVNVKELIFSEYNPRTITDTEFENLKNSIKEFGFIEPVVINKNNQIIGGHQRVRAAQALGLETVPAMIVELDATKEKMLNLALNRISGTWDRDKLQDLLMQLQQEGADLKLTGFEDWEISSFEETGDFVDYPSGVSPKTTYSITVGFEDEESFNKVSAFFGLRGDGINRRMDSKDFIEKVGSLLENGTE